MIAKWRWENGGHLCEGNLKKVLNQLEIKQLGIRNANIGGNHEKENIRLWEEQPHSQGFSGTANTFLFTQSRRLVEHYALNTNNKLINWKQTWFSKAFHSNEPRLVANTWTWGALILNHLSCRLIPYFSFVTRALFPSKKKGLWGYWILAMLLQINVIVIHLVSMWVVLYWCESTKLNFLNTFTCVSFFFYKIILIFFNILKRLFWTTYNIC